MKETAYSGWSEEVFMNRIHKLNRLYCLRDRQPALLPLARGAMSHKISQLLFQSPFFIFLSWVCNKTKHKATKSLLFIIQRKENLINGISIYYLSHNSIQTRIIKVPQRPLYFLFLILREEKKGLFFPHLLMKIK